MGKWLIFGLFGGLLNFVLLNVMILVLAAADTSGDLLHAFLIFILPGLLLWVIGGAISKKEHKYSKSSKVILFVLNFFLWGISIVVVTSYIWYIP